MFYRQGDLMIHTTIAEATTIEEAIALNKEMAARGKPLPLYLHSDAFDAIHQCFYYGTSLEELGKSCLDLLKDYPPIITERPLLGMYKKCHEARMKVKSSNMTKPTITAIVDDGEKVSTSDSESE